MGYGQVRVMVRGRVRVKVWVKVNPNPNPTPIPNSYPYPNPLTPMLPLTKYTDDFVMTGLILLSTYPRRRNDAK